MSIPTHNEILTKWWRRPNHKWWFRVSVFSAEKGYYRPNPNKKVGPGWHKQEEFANFESATEPPEAIYG